LNESETSAFGVTFHIARITPIQELDAEGTALSFSLCLCDFTYSEDLNTMKTGDVVVIDAAGEYSMYASDITRTLPVNGHFTARQREIYDIVLGAQEAAMAAFQSGKSMLTGESDLSLYKVAKDYINSHGKDLHGEPLGKYFIHGLGHYTGLNVHDAGDYKVPLGPGTAFNIEPGIYIPEENFGLRIEDDFYVDAGGATHQTECRAPVKGGRCGEGDGREIGTRLSPWEI
jgi:Xaa-Pro aminopeptidase